MANKYFSKEKFETIIRTIGASNGEFAFEDKQSAEALTDACLEYVKAVDQMETSITAARFRMNDEDYRNFIQTLDKRRSIYHEGLIARLSAFDAIATYYGCEPMFTGDRPDRYAVADFAGELVNTLFENRGK